MRHVSRIVSQTSRKLLGNKKFPGRPKVSWPGNFFQLAKSMGCGEKSQKFPCFLAYMRAPGNFFRHQETLQETQETFNAQRMQNSSAMERAQGLCRHAKPGRWQALFCAGEGVAAVGF